MRTPLLLAVAILALAIPTQAQTTGIAGFNDYTINALGSGSTSCTSLTFLTPVTLNFQVSGPPLTPVMIYVSFLPCAPGTFTGASCQGTTLDLAPFPAPLPLTVGLTNGLGLFNYTLTIPPSPPITVASQAVLLCIPSFLPLFTQAYDITLT